MSNYFVIRQSDEKIVNVVVWDGVSPWRPNEGHYVELAVSSIGIGWQKINGEWIDSMPQEPEE